MIRKLMNESLSIYNRIILRCLERHFRSGLGDSCWVLYGLVRALKPSNVVEIGSARGKSACYMAMALRENGHGMLHAIDPHSPTNWNDTKSVYTFGCMKRTIMIMCLRKWITLVRSTSLAAGTHWSTSIDLLFIDGDHSYEGVKKDFELFSPHMTDRGICVFHDTAWNINDKLLKQKREDMGVPDFVDKLRREGYPVLTLPQDYGVSLVQTCRNGLRLSVAS